MNRSVKIFNSTLVLWVIWSSKNMLIFHSSQNWFIILFLNSAPLSVCKIVGTLWAEMQFLNASRILIVVLQFNWTIYLYLAVRYVIMEALDIFCLLILIFWAYFSYLSLIKFSHWIFHYSFWFVLIFYLISLT